MIPARWILPPAIALSTLLLVYGIRSGTEKNAPPAQELSAVRTVVATEVNELESQIRSATEAARSLSSSVLSLSNFKTPLPVQDARNSRIIQEIRKLDQQRIDTVKETEQFASDLSARLTDIHQRMTGLELRVDAAIVRLERNLDKKKQPYGGLELLVIFVGLIGTISTAAVAWLKEDRDRRAESNKDRDKKAASTYNDTPTL